MGQNYHRKNILRPEEANQRVPAVASRDIGSLLGLEETVRRNNSIEVFEGLCSLGDNRVLKCILPCETIAPIQNIFIYSARNFMFQLRNKHMINNINYDGSRVKVEKALMDDKSPYVTMKYETYEEFLEAIKELSDYFVNICGKEKVVYGDFGKSRRDITEGSIIYYIQRTLKEYIG